jgi:hypothetical protein
MLLIVVAEAREQEKDPVPGLTTVYHPIRGV